MAGNMNQQTGGLAGVNSGRLFLGSCFALIATSVNFAVIAGIMGALKTQFILTNEQVGDIAGAATFGFTISIFVLGPLVDVLGMKREMWFAFLCHVAGVLLMVFAKDYRMLWSGALVLSIGNGTVEAVCNPLVATVYPDQKTRKFNQFHVWFPGGIVLGGLACFALGQVGIVSWKLRLCLILIPAVIYGILFLGQKFPATERVQSGLSFGDMVKGALLRPLFILLFFCMMITASLELGPGRWIPSILEAGGILGILVLAYINGIMAVLRFFAGPVIRRLSPTGLLLASAILAGIGLFCLSYSESGIAAFGSATIFALGVCYFWPTMLGVTSERVPKGGALALALMGGIGMAAVGIFTAPQMGRLADKYLPDKLPAPETRVLMQDVVATFPGYEAKAEGKLGEDIKAAVAAAQGVVTAFEKTGQLPHPATANALREIIKAKPAVANAIGGKKPETPLVNKAESLLNPADNYGGRMSFRKVAPFAIILIIVFGALYITDRARGGYKQEHIGS